MRDDGNSSSILKPLQLAAVGAFWLLAACTQVQITPVPTRTPEPAPSETPAPTRTPTPDTRATADAERFAQTVQAYQTEVAAEKATERALGENGEAPEALSPENAGAIEALSEVEIGPEIFGAYFDPGGCCAAALTDGATTIIHLIPGLPAATIQGDSLFRIAFSGRGGYAAGLPDGTIHIAGSGGEAPRALDVHEDRITALAFTPDDSALISAGIDGILQITAADSGERMTTIDLLEAFGGEPQVDSIRFSPDGQRAALYLVNQSALWVGSLDSLLSGTPVGEVVPWVDHAGPVASAAIGPDWETLAWISRGTLQLMTIDGDLIGGRIQHQDWFIHTAYIETSGVFLAATIDTDGGGERGILRAYSLEDGAEVFSLEAPEPVAALAISPEGAYAAAGHYDGAVRVWDLAARIERFTLGTTDGLIQSLAFSPDGALLLVVDSANIVHLVDAATGEDVRQFDFSAEDQVWAGFSGEGAYIAVVTTGGAVVLYGVSSVE